MGTPLKQLSEHGQSVWIDYLSRSLIRDGDLARLIGDGVDGVTSNPTIFQAAIAEGDAYDEQLPEVLQTRERSQGGVPGAGQGGHPRCLRRCCGRVFDRGEKTRDGWVSLEVDPNLAYQTRRRRSRRRSGCTR